MEIIKKNKISVASLIFVFIAILFISLPVSSSALSLDTNVNNAEISNSLSAGSDIGTTDTSYSSSGSSCSKPKDIGTLFDFARCIISSSVIPLIIGFGVLLFMIGIVRYVASGDNEEQREASRNTMIYGIITIFVMVSVWGFVKILSTTFGFDYSMPSLPPSATTNP
ncbi:MAG: hypothetical protein WCO18_00650 [bacterium]